MSCRLATPGLPIKSLVRTFEDFRCRAKADEIAQPLVSYLLTFAALEAERICSSEAEAGGSRCRVFLCAECRRMPRSAYYWKTVTAFLHEHFPEVATTVSPPWKTMALVH